MLIVFYLINVLFSDNTFLFTFYFTNLLNIIIILFIFLHILASNLFYFIYSFLCNQDFEINKLLLLLLLLLSLKNSTMCEKIHLLKISF